MGRWLILTGGLLIWATHFLGVYMIASVADVASFAGDPRGRLVAAGLTLACLAGLGALFLLLRRRSSGAGPKEPGAFILAVGKAGCVLAGVGVIYQALPLWLI